MEKRIKEKGVTLLESIVATAVIAVGFIAIFQMVNYSVQSIDVSSERTKANYLVSMIAEDIIGSKNSVVESSVTFKQKLLTGIGNNKERIAWKMPNCTDSTVSSAGTNSFNNNIKKWNNRFSKKRLKCKSKNDHKHLYVYEICSSLINPKPTCTFYNKETHFLKSSGDDPMLIGKMETRLNNGKTKKVLFFQID